MPDLAIEPGAYARKQILSPSRLVRWSHGSRFELGRALIAPRAGGRLLDYGCGDGTFLALVHDLFPGAVGADPAARQTADCARRLRDLPLTFTTPDSLGASHTGAYDVVTCMEVLEHCLDDERRRVVGELARLARPGGLVVVSVPIEVGPSLVGKQVARALAAWRGLGDYRASRDVPARRAGPDGLRPRRDVGRSSVVTNPPDPMERRSDTTGTRVSIGACVRDELRRRFTIRSNDFLADAAARVVAELAGVVHLPTLSVT